MQAVLSMVSEEGRESGLSSLDSDHPLDECSETHAPIARCVAGALTSDGKVLLVKRSPQSRFYPDV